MDWLIAKGIDAFVADYGGVFFNEAPMKTLYFYAPKLLFT